MDHNKMDHIQILKRSWEILWHYRALWLFGILVAIVAASGSSSGGRSNYNFNSQDTNPFQSGDDWSFEMQQFWESIEDYEAVILGVGIALICVLLVINLVFYVLHYVANTSLIRMVNDYEETGEKRTIGQGFRMGWSRATWRIFLIDLLIGLPMTLVFLILMAISLSPLLLWLTDSEIAGILGTIAAIGIFFLLILIMIVISTAYGILRQFIIREVALNNLGVFDSIRAGFSLVRKNLKDSIIMWLMLLGVQIAYAIVMIIPSILLFFFALFVAIIPGLMAAGIGLLIGGGAIPWILGIIVGLFVLAILIWIPTILFTGWKEVYLSSCWTLTYREFMAMKSIFAQSESVTDNEGIVDVETHEAEEKSEPDVEEIP